MRGDRPPPACLASLRELDPDTESSLGRFVPTELRAITSRAIVLRRRNVDQYLHGPIEVQGERLNTMGLGLATARPQRRGPEDQARARRHVGPSPAGIQRRDNERPR